MTASFSQRMLPWSFWPDGHYRCPELDPDGASLVTGYSLFSADLADTQSGPDSTSCGQGCSSALSLAQDLAAKSVTFDVTLTLDDLMALDQSPDPVIAFWTPERMAAAKGMELIVDPPLAVSALAVSRDDPHEARDTQDTLIGGAGSDFIPGPGPAPVLGQYLEVFVEQA